jgi:hypothetical protein
MIQHVSEMGECVCFMTAGIVTYLRFARFLTGGRHMKRRIPEAPAQPAEAQRAVDRRALLIRGGAVAAGAAGAVAAGVAVAAPAGAAVSDPVLQGEVNNAGTNVAATEITADNDPATPTPTLILTNTGGDAGSTEASPNLRLTPAATALVLPSSATAGGDLLAGGDGNLWFTHAIPNVGPVAATVHTDATDNLFVPLAAPNRILDTRSSAGRASVLDASGNLNSSGMLIGGKTIHVNLTSMVSFGDAVTANLTVTKPAGDGFLTLWSGASARPTASAIDYASGQTIANLTVSGLAEFSPTATDTIAIFANVTTHVLLDVAAFAVGSIGQVNPTFLAPATSGAARAKRAQQALARMQSQSR